MHTILVAAVTANGFIARSTNELANWSSKEDKQFFTEETKKAGVMIMGRTTFATIGKALPGRLIVVLTEKPDEVVVVPGSVETASGDLRTILESLEKRGFSNIVIAGGSNVYSQFLNAGLVDEIALTVEAIMFTDGIRLAQNLKTELAMTLIETRVLGEKSVLLRYRMN
ncbi:MAG: dihydrofolate reductase family protein [Patescibacteria group bacterium]|jgi:dihydrofolate reductase